MAALAGLPADTRGAAGGSGRLPRVLYAAQLDPSRKFGSLEELAYLLACAFQQRGGLFLPVFMAPPEAVGLARYRAAGLDCAALDLGRFRPGRLMRLLRLTSRYNIDLVHWNFYPALTNGYVWAMTVLAPRVKHCFTDHNSRPVGVPASSQSCKGLKRFFLKRYARVCGVSQFVVDCLRQQGVWPNPIRCLCFVNTDRFIPNLEVRREVRQRLDAEDRFVLLATAFLIPEKGIDVALRALAQLPDRVVLWVVGDGGEMPALVGLSEELGVQQRVRFLGLQSRVEPFMQAADVFVCPSVWAEAAGLVNIEAQACGLPVAASRVGGIPEVVFEGKTGLLFPAGDGAALAKVIQQLLDDPQQFQQMSRQAREVAVQQFSASARLDDHLELYRSALQEFPR